MTDGAGLFIAVALLGLMFSGEPDISDGIVCYISPELCQIKIEKLEPTPG